MKILFFGTPEFAVEHLQALLAAKIDVASVFTRQDKPAGRGNKLQPTPVAIFAENKKIPIFKLKTLKDEESQKFIRNLNPDLIVVVAIGLIIPQEVLDIPKYGIINVHPSLLPRWRGASPIQYPILTGDLETGVTIMKMDSGLDTGPILLQEKCEITANDTTATLYEKLGKISVKLLIEAIKNIEILKPIPQDDSKTCYANKIEKQDAKINWNESAEIISRKIRAFNPWPIAFSKVDATIIKIYSAIPLAKPSNTHPGTIVAINSDSIDIATGDGTLRIFSMQFPGKKVMPTKEILKSKKEFFEKNSFR